MIGTVRRWWPLPAALIAGLGADAAFKASYGELGEHAAGHLASASALFPGLAVVTIMLWAAPRARRQMDVWSAAAAWLAALVVVMIGNLQVVDVIGTEDRVDDAVALGVVVPGIEAGHDLAAVGAWVGVGAAVLLAIALLVRGHISPRVAIGSVALTLIVPPFIIPGAGALVLVVGMCLARRAREAGPSTAEAAVTPQPSYPQPEVGRGPLPARRTAAVPTPRHRAHRATTAPGTQRRRGPGPGGRAGTAGPVRPRGRQQRRELGDPHAATGRVPVPGAGPSRLRLSDPLLTELGGDGLPRHGDTLLVDVLDALDLASAHVVSTSMGGYFTLRTAAAHPDRVDRIVQLGWTLGAPTPPLPAVMRLASMPGIGRMMAALPVGERTVRSMFRQTGLRQALDTGRIPQQVIDCYVALLRHTDTRRSEFTMSGGTSFPDLISQVGLPDELLARIQTPTLFLWGEHDPFGPPDIAHHFVAQIPDARLRIVPGAGHAVWLDDLDLAATTTRTFLTTA